MSRQFPWARILAEGFVIVASVLMALGADAWWARHREQVEARRELALIHDELAEDRTRLNRTFQAHSSIAAAALEIAELLGVGEDASVSVPDTLLWWVVRVPTFEPRAPALDGLLASGRISLIDDVAVRSAVSEWERAVRNTAELEARARRLADELLVPALSERGDVGHILRSEAADVPFPGEALEPLMAQLRLDPTASTLLMPSPELEAAISQRFQAAARATSGLGFLLAATDGLIEATRTARVP